jgi:ribosomal-protein-alanine N-acetyltransferase
MNDTPGQPGVVLTELRDGDSPALFAWINDPRTVRFNAPYAPVHAPDHDAWFRAVTRDSSRIMFAIRSSLDARILGTVQLIDLQAIHRTAELVIRIGNEDDRGKGIGSRAVALAINYAFRHRNLQRVWLRVFAHNAQAIRAYEKAGMQIEGRMRRACFIDGAFVDELIMAKLADLG